MDPHKDLQVGALFGWTIGYALDLVEKYKQTLKKIPEPTSAQHHQASRRQVAHTQAVGGIPRVALKAVRLPVLRKRARRHIGLEAEPAG